MNTEPVLSNDEVWMDAALALHDLVFGESRETTFNSKTEWQKRIAAGGYFVVCVADGAVIGYSVCDVTPEGDFKIWLAGVHPDARGRGIWSQLFANIKQHARAAGYEYVLLNTFPSKYPAMYAFLQSVGAEIYKQELFDGEEKHFAKIAL